MALNRQDNCRKFEDNTGFLFCLCYYAADHGGKNDGAEIQVTKAMMEGNAVDASDPTDAEIHAVADAKGTTWYNTWKDNVDAEAAAGKTETNETGHSATVIA